MGGLIMLKVNSFQGNLNLLVLTLVNNNFIKSDDRVNWSKENADKNIESKIRQECGRVNALALLILFITLVTGFLHVCHTRSDDDVYLVVFALNRINVFGFEKSIKLVYKLSLIPFCYSMTIMPLQAIYYLQHTRCQFQILTAEFRQIDFIKVTTKNSNLIQNASYQTKINEKFKICTHKHQTLLRFLDDKNSSIEVNVLPIVITGCMHGIGVPLYILNGIRLGFISRAIFSASLFVSVFWSLITIGQLQKESSEDLAEAVHHLNWYNWNSKNRKIYLISLTSSPKPYSLNFNGIAVDYLLGIKIIRIIYQTVSVFLQIKLARS